MANKYDGNRYDTTIKIPYNLPEGVYVLQYMSAMSAHKTFYYSCARIKISGGKPALPCKRTGLAPVAYGCMKGMAVPLSKYEKDTKMGNFCFSTSGLGDQDADIRKVPVNADCDPRITCQLSVQYKRCMEADNKMKDITNASDPKQVCSGDVRPPPEPTCNDGKRNNGEQMVDCGGPNCDACYEEPTEPVDERIYSDLKYKEKVLLERGMMEVRASLVVKKAANDWRFAIFLDKPVKWTHFWNCKLISVNKYNTIWTFGPMPWTKKVKPGQKINLGFNGRFESDGEAPQTVTKSFVEYKPDELE
ncbi:uncharacterized protein LOC134815293 isoform X1 [Bolinopsis microptera]|uniref:uncharacterized protein LOC134815293 isoform X1 n=1 Tax=Bolinopsis microptera TaxID=2820187 RepID=UPI0030790963